MGWVFSDLFFDLKAPKKTAKKSTQSVQNRSVQTHRASLGQFCAQAAVMMSEFYSFF